MVTLEIVARKDIGLPDELHWLIAYLKKEVETINYTVYMIELDYLGDEHIIPLNNAYSVCQIVHWSCGGETAFNYTNHITLN